jgi:hypothetical protein
VGPLDERLDRRLGVVDGLLVAPAQGAHGGRHQAAILIERLAAHAQHELGVGGRAVVVDLELVHARALGLQGHALGVPEGRGRVDLARQQRGDGLEADRDLLDLGRVAAVATHDRAQDGIVGGQAGDPGALTLQVARPRDLGLGDDGGQRALHEGHHADDVAPLLAGQGQVVDVEDRELRAPGEQELDAVGRGRRRRDAQIHALGAVEVALQGQVDAGVHGIGLEVQDELGRLVGPVLRAA